MKNIYKLTIIIIAIPFFIVFFLVKEEIKKQKPEIIIDSSINVRVKRESYNRIDNVNLEMYVLGVVAGEMPIIFDVEALKAQAVASRTYVLKRLDSNKNIEYDVTDTTQNQVYKDINQLKEKWDNDYNNNIFKISLAVMDTKGEYLTFDEKIIDALFFSTSNGYTENSEDFFVTSIPYLRSVASEWDKKYSPVFNSQKTLSLNEFCINLNIKCNNMISVNNVIKSTSGRIVKLNINNKSFTGREIKNILKLKSNDFEIIQNNELITIKTKGYGHGVGMSQYGAFGMAMNGFKYKEILSYYYKDTKIKNIYEK